MSILHIRCSSHKKVRLLNVYKKSLILTFILFNMYIPLLLEGGNGTKCWYTQKPRKIGRSAILEPNLKQESHNHVTNPMFHFYCALSTMKQRKSKELLCSFIHPENCKNSEEKYSNIKMPTYLKRAVSPVPYLKNPARCLRLSLL